MPTDDERREVAEFLRRSVGKGASLLLLVAFAAFDVKATDGERIVTADEAALRLAALIEPIPRRGYDELVPIMAAAREFFRQQGGRTSSAVPRIEDGEVAYEVD